MEDYKEKIISLMEGNELTDEEKATFRKAFPELVESEDEKIRKRIIAFLRSPFVMNDIADDILAPWIAFLEKVKDFDKQLEEAYKNSDEVQYKRGYDDGYVEGIVAAKKELEKQGVQKPVISGDALREGIAHFGITQYQIDNWLKKYVDIEKPITIGKRQLTGKAKELYDNLDAESLAETKEKMLAETSKWTEEDERLLTGIYYTLEGIAPLSYKKEIDWLKSIKERLQ